MAIQYTGHEPFRYVKLNFTFNGNANSGANGDLTINKNPIPTLNEGEFIYQVFYRVTTTLTSGDSDATYLQLGINVDESDAILGATTGIVDTLNTGSTGTIPVHKYTKATVDNRTITGSVGGTDDITAGSIEIILTIARCNEIFDGTEFISTDIES